MNDNRDMSEPVCVTLTVDQWAKVIASVGVSRLDLSVKEVINSKIYDCVRHTERALS